MKLICSYCGRDLNEIGQDNMSETCEDVCCEDCAGIHNNEEAFYDYELENYLQLQCDIWNAEKEVNDRRNI